MEKYDSPHNCTRYRFSESSIVQTSSLVANSLVIGKIAKLQTRAKGNRTAIEILYFAWPRRPQMTRMGSNKFRNVRPFVSSALSAANLVYKLVCKNAVTRLDDP